MLANTAKCTQYAEVINKVERKLKMPEIKWTDAQKAAINVKANKILVSAAAGSGKSTVLTARIISALTKKKCA